MEKNCGSNTENHMNYKDIVNLIVEENSCQINRFKVKSWYKGAILHRDDDKPAIIYPNGTKWWYQHGYVHRDNDKPAVTVSNGKKVWYQNDNRHRDNDQPAVIHADGTKEWWLDGKFIKEKSP